MAYTPRFWCEIEDRVTPNSSASFGLLPFRPLAFSTSLSQYLVLFVVLFVIGKC